MMSSVGATRMSHVVSGGEVGRALHLPLYLHLWSYDGAYLVFGYVFVFVFVLICVLHNV